MAVKTQDDNGHGRGRQPCEAAVKEVSSPMLVRYVAMSAIYLV